MSRAGGMGVKPAPVFESYLRDSSRSDFVLKQPTELRERTDQQLGAGGRAGPGIILCLKLLRKSAPSIIINCTSAPPALRALTKLQKAAFRKIEPLYLVEVP